jgi:uncharacterized protein (TIGR02118 family)
MFKLVALWSAPQAQERDAFEKDYLGTHAPLARRVPHLAGLETILVGEGLEGSAAPFHRTAVMIWPDKASFERCEKSPAWAALRADAGQMIERYGVTLTSFMGHDG